jgi:peroxiredoxin Q/BCP
LPDQDGALVSLQDLRGRWVVLYFYPKDDTPGCTVEACEFTAANQAFAGLDAVVFGCSADGAEAHRKFIGKHRLGIRLLTDADRKVMVAYGAYGKKMMYGKQVEGVIRSTVLIAPDGQIAHHWATVKAAGHAEQVRQRLAELQGGMGEAGPASPASAGAKKAMAMAKGKPVVKAKAKAKGTVAVKPAAKSKSAAKPAAKKPAQAAPTKAKVGKLVVGKAKPVSKAAAKPAQKVGKVGRAK